MDDTDITEVAEAYMVDPRFTGTNRNEWLAVVHELHERFGFKIGDEIFDAACALFLERVRNDYYESDEA